MESAFTERLNSFARNSDFLNTLQGGTSMPVIWTKSDNQHYELMVKMPGVKEENFVVHQHNQLLNIRILIQSNSQQSTEHTMASWDCILPHFVDLTSGNTHFEHNTLYVRFKVVEDHLHIDKILK